MEYRQLRRDNDFGIIYTDGKNHYYEEDYRNLSLVPNKKISKPKKRYQLLVEYKDGMVYTNGKDFCYEECSHESLLPVTDKKKINELEKILKQKELRNNKLKIN